MTRRRHGHDPALVLRRSCSDPRLPSTRRYPLADIVLIVFCGLLSGADNVVEIARWAATRQPWFRDKLAIERIPSHDTPALVLAKRIPEELNTSLMRLSQPLQAPLPSATFEPPEPEVIALPKKRSKERLASSTLSRSRRHRHNSCLQYRRPPTTPTRFRSCRHC